MRYQKQTVLAAALLTAPFLWGPVRAGAAGGTSPARQPEPVRVSLPEARRMVRLMDDIYRIGVLTTHGMYVREPGVPAAITWGKQVLAQVNAQGWPQARIFAVSDRPLNPDNNPRDAFERDAIQAFKAGKSRLEQQEAGVLHYASEIRIADKSCLTCHVRNKEGDLLGGVSFRAVLTAPAAPGKR